MKHFKFLTLFLIHFTFNAVQAQEEIKLGAYYFDGWTGETLHATPKLKTDFPERKPVWGWITSTPEIVGKQIDAAKDAGLDFFSFCWYYNSKTQGKDVARDVKNNALVLYQQSSNKHKLGFTLLVANHGDYAILATEWKYLAAYWINLFKDPSYIKANNKPLITFFDINSLVKSFGTPKKVQEALDTLRIMARKEGLLGVSIAANTEATQVSVDLAKKCGFDILTGYNYHTNGLSSSDEEIVPIDSMRTNEARVWSFISKLSGIPIIPAITVNWDRRPWDTDEKKRSPRFSGYGSLSISKAVASCRNWISNNKTVVVQEKLAVLYAWNEYGEGAYLTPSKNNSQILDGVKKALMYRKPSSSDPR